MTLLERKAGAVRNGPRKLVKPSKQPSSGMESTASDPTHNRGQSWQARSDGGSTRPAKIRADYRAVRAAKEGKKFINVLIDEELQLEVRPRMMLRKLTWETLIESLLKKWLKANPKFRP